jgi:hypothetical protein
MMPDNAGYMFAAYVAAALVFGGYAVSLVMRARAVSRREETIAAASRR